jgi:arabinose-5-phosphate isomerase
VTIAGDMLGVEALRVMEERKITSVVVVGPDRSVQGVVHLHDLWRTQMI